MAPRVQDVDAQQLEGAQFFKIGGRYFVAPEPDMETLRQVTLADIEAERRVLAELRALEGRLAEASGQRNTDERDTDVKIIGDAVLEGITALVPNLQLLLYHCKVQTGLHGDNGDRHEEVDHWVYADADGNEVDASSKVPITAEWANAHLSGNRAHVILRAILGEGLSRA